MTKKQKNEQIATWNSSSGSEWIPAAQWSWDGYSNDGYLHKSQINVKLTEEDIQNINSINEEFFDREVTTSTLARILIRRGIKSFKNLK